MIALCLLSRSRLGTEGGNIAFQFALSAVDFRCLYVMAASVFSHLAAHREVLCTNLSVILRFFVQQNVYVRTGKGNDFYSS